MKSFGYEEVVWWETALWSPEVQNMLIVIIAGFIIVGLLRDK